MVQIHNKIKDLIRSFPTQTSCQTVSRNSNWLTFPNTPSWIIFYIFIYFKLKQRIPSFFHKDTSPHGGFINQLYGPSAWVSIETERSLLEHYIFFLFSAFVSLVILDPSDSQKQHTSCVLQSL